MLWRKRDRRAAADDLIHNRGRHASTRLVVFCRVVDNPTPTKTKKINKNSNKNQLKKKKKSMDFKKKKRNFSFL